LSGSASLDAAYDGVASRLVDGADPLAVEFHRDDAMAAVDPRLAGLIRLLVRHL
jgi:hypothetical protein